MRQSKLRHRVTVKVITITLMGKIIQNKGDDEERQNINRERIKHQYRDDKNNGSEIIKRTRVQNKR